MTGAFECRWFTPRSTRWWRRERSGSAGRADRLRNASDPIVSRARPVHSALAAPAVVRRPAPQAAKARNLSPAKRMLGKKLPRTTPIPPGRQADDPQPARDGLVRQRRQQRARLLRPNLVLNRDMGPPARRILRGEQSREAARQVLADRLELGRDDADGDSPPQIDQTVRRGRRGRRQRQGGETPFEFGFERRRQMVKQREMRIEPIAIGRKMRLPQAVQPGEVSASSSAVTMIGAAITRLQRAGGPGDADRIPTCRRRLRVSRHGAFHRCAQAWRRAGPRRARRSRARRDPRRACALMPGSRVYRG